MGTQTRKQREIADREDLILDVARKLLVERGYLGVTMDRIAAATEYSKGTIYQHFPNKEDILATIAAESAEKRVALFEKAATFHGRPRERLAALGLAEELFVALYPLHFQCERIVDAQSIREKTSAECIRRLDACEAGCMQVALGLVRDGVAQGDLEYDDPQTPQTMVLGLWSMSNGFHLISSANENWLERKLGFTDPFRALLSCYNHYLDGFGWRPLSTEWNYNESLERVRAEVFQDEIRSIHAS